MPSHDIRRGEEHLLVRWGKAATAALSGIRWSRVGLVLSATIIAISVFILWHRLSDLDIDGVMAAMRDMPARNIAVAAGAIAMAYGSLTFYDWFALRTIGAGHVPFRIAALASFTSYSIGHNVGATALTGGAIRYRIYSYRGLRVIDIAKICFITGLTFWLGNLTVLGFAMVYMPDAARSVDHLPIWANRALGVAALCVLAGYIIYVHRAPRSFGTDRWRVTLPDGRLTLLQIVIGIADLFFCAIAMSMLIPAEPYISFVSLAVIFVFAALFGFASHAPGSLGVFDAAMLLALGQFDREGLVAGLLLFRLLYFILPFSLALAIIGVRELWLVVTGAEPIARPSHWP